MPPTPHLSSLYIIFRRRKGTSTETASRILYSSHNQTPILTFCFRFCNYHHDCHIDGCRACITLAQVGDIERIANERDVKSKMTVKTKKGRNCNVSVDQVRTYLLALCDDALFSALRFVVCICLPLCVPQHSDRCCVSAVGRNPRVQYIAVFRVTSALACSIPISIRFNGVLPALKFLRQFRC